VNLLGIKETEKTKAVKQELDALCRKVIVNRNWKPFNDLKVTAYPGPSPLLLLAHIALNDWRIHLTAADTIHESIASVKAKENLEVEDYLWKMVNFTVVHEHSHYEHCPKTLELFRGIVEASYEVIEPRETSKRQIIEKCFQVHNMFSDTVLNTINSYTDADAELYREGMALDYLVHALAGKKFKAGKDKAFALFLNSNLHLCGIGEDYRQKLKKYGPWIFLGWERYRRKLIEVFTGDEALTDVVMYESIDKKASEDLVARMKDTSQWPEMAKKYTEIIYPFLRRKGQKKLQSSFTDPEPKSSEEENQEGGSGNDSKGEGSSNDSGKGGDKENEREKMFGRGKNKQKGKGGKDRELGFLGDLFDALTNMSHEQEYLKDYDKLDKLYTERAGRIAVVAEDEQGRPQHELNLSETEMSLDQFRSKDVLWSSTKIHTGQDGKKRFEFYRGDCPIVIPFDSSNDLGTVLDLAFIFDSSGSMEFLPYQGKGEYHLAVLTFYSILEDLKDKGLASFLNYNIINYSGAFSVENSTKTSGWCSYADIHNVKRALLSYQGNGTILDPKALADLRMNRRDNFICFMLTDGGFNYTDNQAHVIDEVSKMIATPGIYYCLFQIGPQTEFSTAVEKLGAPVHYVKSADDFMKMTVRFTDQMYQRVTV
jgi:hypothetical protein